MPHRSSDEGILVATCGGGLEEILAAEITALGLAVIKTDSGAVRFRGGVREFSLANLWLRTASRVLKPIASGPVQSFDDLYAIVRRMRWVRFAPPAKSIGVTVVSDDRRLSDTRFAALRIKDAIVDSQQRSGGKRSTVNRRDPDVGVVARISRGQVEISLDTTGQPLHMRGYRTEAGTAPLRETTAAALVLLSGWDGSGSFADPFCGAGTIIIEAALIADGLAPSRGREDFAFLRWPGADRESFRKTRDQSASGGRVRQSANGTRGDPVGQTQVRIHGTDIDPEAIAMARRNAERAGVSHRVSFEVSDFFDGTGQANTIVTNPPYGERMDMDDAPGFYAQVGDCLKTHHRGSTAWILSANREAMKRLGLRTSRKIPLYNGGLDSRLFKIDIY